ncbi:hypothetical protein KIV45_18990 [Janthinobacterium lividum]|nr:hypothetical protein KIV45_18990 [Janthinobacterium lividum]
MTDEDEVDYELTTRQAPFKGTVVSRRSVANLIASIIETPGLHVHANLGVNKPNTDGDKPYFMQLVQARARNNGSCAQRAKIAFTSGDLSK